MSEQKNEDISGLQEVSHINSAVVLIFRYFQYIHWMYFDVAWVLVSLGTQAQS